MKGAESREAHAKKAQLAETRTTLRRSAEEMRRDAARVDPERLDIERRLAALDAPIHAATAQAQGAHAAHDAARGALSELRATHRRRLDDLGAARGLKLRAVADAGADIVKRQVSLGTLVNRERVERDDLTPLYTRVDELLAEVAVRQREIGVVEEDRRRVNHQVVRRGAAMLASGFGALAAMIVIIIIITHR